MSRRDRRDSDRRDGDRRDGDRRPGDRRDVQPDDDQQQRLGEGELQESDSLTALKAILARVAALLQPLQLTQDESIRLVEQLYGSVLDMDVRLAGEADDRRKSSVLAQIQNAVVTRGADNRIVVHFPVAASEPETPAGGGADSAPVAAPAEHRDKVPTGSPVAGMAAAETSMVRAPGNGAPMTETQTVHTPAAGAPAAEPGDAGATGASSPKTRPTARPRPKPRQATPLKGDATPAEAAAPVEAAEGGPGD